MIVGPVLSRELVTLPRRARLYVSRAMYVAVLLTLIGTSWAVLTGTQEIRSVGDLARFGTLVFQILAPLQLVVVIFLAALGAASAVAQEKDRRTLDLLLLTKLNNSELVLGKLLASLLQVLTMLLGAWPLFMLTMLWGGVELVQLAQVYGVTILAALCAGSLGSIVALWREKTFQTLAMTALALVAWWVGGEIVASGALGIKLGSFSPAEVACCISPWHATAAASRPMISAHTTLLSNPVLIFLLVACAATLLINLLAIALIRVWNPSREAPQRREEPGAEQAGVADPQTAPARKTIRTRQVWDNPILWREMRTRAYGRKTLAIRLVYVALFCLCAYVVGMAAQGSGSQIRARTIGPMALLGILGLVLLNAQAVTSLTSERDARAIDLLLVTDLTPKEFIFGKLGGVLYNAKEVVLLPLGLCGYLWFVDALSLENLLYILVATLTLVAFVNVLGVHVGMNYANSRTAIGVSLGTVFFLSLGVFVGIQIMVAFAGSFQVQLVPFVVMMFGGGIGMYVALGLRNPSSAIFAASLTCPFATFWAIVSFVQLQYTQGVCAAILLTYSFATASMLVPAIWEFDVATGRTTGADA